jgi:Spy/CpxP family protein refolding chaperone
MRPRAKGALLLILAFLLGAAAGGFGFGVYRARFGRHPGPEQFERMVLHRLSRELDLKPDQQEQVQAILRDTGQDFARLREEMRPRFQEIRTKGRDRIRAVLDPSQQTKFEALSARWEQRAEQRHGPLR